MPWDKINISPREFTSNVTNRLALSEILCGGRLMSFSGNHFSTIGTNLYVELFTDSGRMMDHYLFPVIHGQSIGQVALPDSLPSGVYWLRFYTRHQAAFDSDNMCMIPVTVVQTQDKDELLTKQLHAAKNDR